MSTRSRLRLEALDDRLVPATFGTPWPLGNLTVSFAPDGTNVDVSAGASQPLPGVPADVWQREVLRAFQTWAVSANLNIGLVADGGQPFGTPGAPQGDARFGDVRVAAVPMDPAGAVALGTPFDLNAGTRSGDVWFNSAVTFGAGGSPGYDVFSVALHEAGHVLGVGENEDPTSAMFDQAVTHVGLSPADVLAVQALYGARKPDAFDAKAPNDTLKTASPVQVGSGPGQSATANVTADITTATDTDVYVFQPSNLQGAGLTAAVHVSGYSLLVPRLEILDASGQVIASGVGAAPGAGDVTLHLTGLVSGATYYARVTGASAGVFGIGGYKLELRPDAASAGGSGGPTQLLNPDTGSNDTIGTATQLGQQFLTTTGGRFEYTLSASLNSSTDVDFYRLRAPQTANNAPVLMTVSVWTTPPGGTDPVADVYDTHGTLLGTAVLVHDGGAYTAQVSVPSNTDYYVAVRHAHPGPAAVPGNYFLGVDFGGSPVRLTDFASDTLTATAPIRVIGIQVNEPQVLHLVLDLTHNPAGTTAGARVAIFDSAGHLVDTRYVPGGDAASLNVALQPGAYHLLVGGGTTDGSAYSGVAFDLLGLTLSDPVGPLPVGTTSQPAGSPPSTTSPPPTDPTQPPVAVSTAVTPVAPIGPAWWVAPPTDWTAVEWSTVSDLLLASPTGP